MQHGIMGEAQGRGAPALRDAAGLADEAAEMFLTLTVAGQLCGVPVLAVRDVLGAQAITRIPLAPAEVAGSLNLRGRIVTAIDLRRRLGLALREEGTRGAMSVVVGSRALGVACRRRTCTSRNPFARAVWR